MGALRTLLLAATLAGLSLPASFDDAFAAGDKGASKTKDKAKDKAKAAPEPDPVAIIAAPPPGMPPQEPPRQLSRALKNMDQKQWPLASLALHTILQEPENLWYHPEVHLHLAQTLEQMDMPYSALEEYNRFFLSWENKEVALQTVTFESEEEGARVRALGQANDALLPKAIERAVSLARRQDAGWLVAPGLAKLDTSVVSQGHRGPAMYWVGAWHYRNGDYAASTAYLSLVPKDTEYYAESRMLEGIALTRQKKPQESIAPLQAAQKAANRADPMDNIWELSTINLARAYYALGNYERAIELFEKTPRSSPQWAEVLYEVSWAYFRLGRLSGALSHLQTVDSPFFKDHYHPDATLLRILIFYYLCKYKDGQVMLNEFTDKHGAIEKHITTAIEKAGKSPEALYETLYAWRAGGGKAAIDLPVPVKQLFVADESISRLGDYLAGIDAELRTVDKLKTGWEKSDLKKELETQLTDRKTAAVTQKGKEVMAKLRGMQYVLMEHLGNAELYKVEMITAEKNLYDAAYQGRLMERVAKRKPDRSVPEGYRYWPFQGEYWMDELGWYEVNTINECAEIKKQ